MGINMLPICLLLLHACVFGFADDGVEKESPLDLDSPLDENDNSTVGETTLQSNFRKVALHETNKYRKVHGADPLVLDDQLNRESQAYAEELARTNVMEHSCKICNDYGENLYMTKGRLMDLVKVTRKAIKSWYKEVKYYKFKSAKFSKKTGHFTALVWKGSKTMGFGVAVNEKTKSTFVVARYVPPGNMMGAFSQNVGVKAKG